MQLVTLSLALAAGAWASTVGVAFEYKGVSMEGKLGFRGDVMVVLAEAPEEHAYTVSLLDAEVKILKEEDRQGRTNPRVA